MSQTDVKKKTSIGGQALIEGIMMRGPEKTSMAVRNTDGDIVVDTWNTVSKPRPRWAGLPVIRGVVNFVSSMTVGYRCLMRSAELSGLEDEDTSAKPAKKAVKQTPVVPGTAAARPSAEASAPCENPPCGEAVPHEEKLLTISEGEDGPTAVLTKQPDAAAPVEKEDGENGFSRVGWTLVMALSVVLGLAISIGLFISLPTFLFGQITRALPASMMGESRWIWQAVFEGVLKILIFVGYIAAVSLMKDIRRVFMYHGAEHKTIFCYEHGEELTVDNVRRQIRFHPRCGTSFIVLMLLVSIFVSMFIHIGSTPLRTAVKLLTVPIIMGLGYELLKWAARSDNLFVRVVSAPGLWIQRLTTKEPTDDMIEVAIRAFQEVVPEDPEADRL